MVEHLVPLFLIRSLKRLEQAYLGDRQAHHVLEVFSHVGHVKHIEEVKETTRTFLFAKAFFIPPAIIKKNSSFYIIPCGLGFSHAVEQKARWDTG